MRRDHNGFVLFVMLIYLQIFALLGMQTLSRVVYDKKISRVMVVQSNNRDQVLQVLAMMDRNANLSHSEINYSPQFLKRQGLAWWRLHANRGVDSLVEYYYLRQQIALERCARLDGNEVSSRMAIYYLQTLYFPKFERMVQDTIVVPGEVNAFCEAASHQIKSGRQMLRWLR